MARLDLVIRGGKVATPAGVVEADIAIEGEQIVALSDGELKLEGREVIDATGKMVLPGAVDTHVHHREPGFTHKEDITTATAAAAAGGVTFTAGMPNVHPSPTTREIYNQILDLYARKSIVDYNMNPAGTVVEEISRIAAEGKLIAFKFFMVVDTGRDYPHMPGIGVHDHGTLYQLFETIEKTGYPVMVHPHDQELMTYLERRYHERGETNHLAYARCLTSHEGIIWNTAIATLLQLQKATGVHLHLLHMSTVDGIDMVRRAKSAGQHVTCEVNPWALFLGNDWATIERLGPYVLAYYVPPRHAEAAWAALNDGTIDIIATDHAPHTRQEKEVGWTNMWKAHSGAPHIQFYVSLILDAVNKGMISLERAVEVLAAGPARVFGMYPRKGAIAVGSDADLAVVDLKARHTISNEEVLSKIGYTPYAGREVQGVVEQTLVRGRVVYRDGKVIGEPGYGQLISRSAARKQ